MNNYGNNIFCIFSLNIIIWMGVYKCTCRRWKGVKSFCSWVHFFFSAYIMYINVGLYLTCKCHFVQDSVLFLSTTCKGVDACIYRWKEDKIIFWIVSRDAWCICRRKGGWGVCKIPDSPWNRSALLTRLNDL